MEPQEKKSHGALIGSIIIIIILVIGGVYIWQSKINIAKQKAAQEQAIINSENSQTSDLNNLEQQINTTDTNTGVDASQIQ